MAREKDSTKKFVEKMSNKHPNLKASENTSYEGSTKSVTVVCEKHGEVTDRGSNLIHRGCPSCAKEAYYKERLAELEADVEKKYPDLVKLEDKDLDKKAGKEKPKETEKANKPTLVKKVETKSNSREAVLGSAPKKKDNKAVEIKRDAYIKSIFNRGA